MAEINMKIYGIEKSVEEVKSFVQDQYTSVVRQPKDRFHDIISLIPTNATVLDYGCGWGHYSVEIQKKGNKVVGIDLSENEINICKTVWGNHQQSGIDWIVGRIESQEDEKFDCVLSNQVIEHVHNPGHYLSQINRVLKPNGSLVISLPNGVNPRHMVNLLSKNMEFCKVPKLIRLTLRLIICNLYSCYAGINT